MLVYNHLQMASTVKILMSARHQVFAPREFAPTQRVLIPARPVTPASLWLLTGSRVKMWTSAKMPASVWEANVPTAWAPSAARVPLDWSWWTGLPAEILMSVQPLRESVEKEAV